MATSLPTLCSRWGEQEITSVLIGGRPRKELNSTVGRQMRPYFGNKMALSVFSDGSEGGCLRGTLSVEITPKTSASCSPQDSADTSTCDAHRWTGFTFWVFFGEEQGRSAKTVSCISSVSICGVMRVWAQPRGAGQGRSGAGTAGGAAWSGHWAEPGAGTAGGAARLDRALGRARGVPSGARGRQQVQGRSAGDQQVWYDGRTPQH